MNTCNETLHFSLGFLLSPVLILCSAVCARVIWFKKKGDTVNDIPENIEEVGIAEKYDDGDGLVELQI